MRIDRGYDKYVRSLQQTQKETKQEVKETKTPQQGESVSIEISEEAKRLSEATSKVEVSEKAQKIKRAIAEGTYTVSSEKISKGLLKQIQNQKGL